MSLRRTLLAIASIALAVLLIVLLIRISKIDVQVTLRQLQSVRVLSFVKLVLLNSLLVYFSSEKWRSIDAAWRQDSDSVPSRTKSMALTAAGLALGLVFPIQVAMSTARTLGTFGHGRPVKRGAAGTLFEQCFDLLIVVFLGLASGATWFFGGGAVLWTVSAVAMAALALVAAGPLIRLIRWLAATYKAKILTQQNKILRSLGELQHSGLMNASLARRLVAFSLARYGVVVLMSMQTAEAIGEHIPLWQMAAAIPFVVVVSVIGVTPGGLGVNELAMVVALKIFGTPLTVAAPWALANRVLVAVSYFVVAACAAIILSAAKFLDPRARDAIHDH